MKRFCNFCGIQIPKERFVRHTKRPRFCSDSCRNFDANEGRRLGKARLRALNQIHACTPPLKKQTNRALRDFIFDQILDICFKQQEKNKASSPLEGSAQESKQGEHSSDGKGVGVSPVF